MSAVEVLVVCTALFFAAMFAILAVLAAKQRRHFAAIKDVQRRIDAASVGRNAKRRDGGTRLGPKGEHALGEAETPKA